MAHKRSKADFKGSLELQADLDPRQWKNTSSKHGIEHGYNRANDQSLEKGK